MLQSAAEKDRQRAKLLDQASLLLKLAARQQFAGASKPAAESVREARELLAEYYNTEDP